MGGLVSEPAVEVIARDDLELSSAYRAPSTDLERQLVDLWRQFLSVEPVGVDDDFFELGGHSLRAIDLLVATEREVGVHVPARRLYLQPTIAELAEVVEEIRQDETAAPG
jgi:acyl carrier protein